MPASTVLCRRSFLKAAVALAIAPKDDREVVGWGLMPDGSTINIYAVPEEKKWKYTTVKPSGCISMAPVYTPYLPPFDLEPMRRRYKR